MDPIIATGNLMQDNNTAGEPSDWESYLGAAQMHIEAAAVLFAHQPAHSIVGSLLSGLSLECALKAYLLRHGVVASDDPKLRHDLCELWTRAHGLNLPSSPPAWCVELNKGYYDPGKSCRRLMFHYRYVTGAHGTVMPASAEVEAGVRSLIGEVTSALRG